MQFVKYPSFENTYNVKFLEKVRQFINDPIERFYVTEKIHGSNFSLNVNSDTVMAGKRTSLLETTHQRVKFMMCEDIYQRYCGNVRTLFENVTSEFPEAVQVTVYGEFYGGNYESVPSIATKIQAGISYSPGHQFHAFDLCIVNGEGVVTFLSRELVVKFLGQVGIPVVKELFSGTLNECLEWSKIHVTDPTTIPAELKEDVPELKENIREGHVIRPYRVLRFPAGSHIIFKHKTDKFKEILHSKKKKTPKTKVQMSELAQNMVTRALDYVNKQRLASVLSKEGELNPKNRGHVIRALANDAIEEFRKMEDDYNKLTPNEQQQVFKTMSSRSSQVVSEYIENMV